MEETITYKSGLVIDLANVTLEDWNSTLSLLRMIGHLHINNTRDYNMRKAAEELAELSLVLLQKINKPLKVDDADIIDEIGDVKIRLGVLERMYDRSKITERVLHKISKYEGYIADGIYEQI